LIRSILNNSRHARVDLRSELKALELYLELEQMRFEGSFERSITVDPDIDQDAISIPPLILQPYAENAIWHGLMHKQGDRRLEVEISQSNGMLHTSVRDNGIGRSAAQKLKTRSATKHKGLGMDITSEIIKRTHDDGTTGVVIKDLFDAHGDPSGTEVHITIPIVPRP
jgi:LytS/YehU family sensor histidine kinase